MGNRDVRNSRVAEPKKDQYGKFKTIRRKTPYSEGGKEMVKTTCTLAAISWKGIRYIKMVYDQL
jgi:hypothetical protein